MKLGVYIGLGIALGSFIGIITKNLSFWIGLGLVLETSIGLFFSKKVK